MNMPLIQIDIGGRAKGRKRVKERKKCGNQGQRQIGMRNNQKGFRPQISLSQVWSRRQEIQRVLAEPTPMEEVERMNVMVVRNPLQGQEGREEGIRRDLYVITQRPQS